MSWLDATVEMDEIITTGETVTREPIHLNQAIIPSTMKAIGAIAGRTGLPAFTSVFGANAPVGDAFSLGTNSLFVDPSDLNRESGQHRKLFSINTITLDTNGIASQATAVITPKSSQRHFCISFCIVLRKTLA